MIWDYHVYMQICLEDELTQVQNIVFMCLHLNNDLKDVATVICIFHHCDSLLYVNSMSVKPNEVSWCAMLGDAN